MSEQELPNPWWKKPAHAGNAAPSDSHAEELPAQEEKLVEEVVGEPKDELHTSFGRTFLSEDFSEEASVRPDEDPRAELEARSPSDEQCDNSCNQAETFGPPEEADSEEVVAQSFAQELSVETDACDRSAEERTEGNTWLRASGKALDYTLEQVDLFEEIQNRGSDDVNDEDEGTFEEVDLPAADAEEEALPETEAVVRKPKKRKKKKQLLTTRMSDRMDQIEDIVPLRKLAPYLFTLCGAFFIWVIVIYYYQTEIRKIDKLEKELKNSEERCVYMRTRLTAITQEKSVESQIQQLGLGLTSVDVPPYLLHKSSGDKQKK